MIWAMQTNLLVRYGFLKDKEVTFGACNPMWVLAQVLK